ncbi:MAG: hypothetical protein ACFFCQ_09940 [Promethearchaeota archaeon]
MGSFLFLLEPCFFRKSITLAAILHGNFDSPILFHTAGYLSYIEMTVIVFMELVCTFIAAVYLFFFYYTSYQTLLEERIVQKNELLLRAQKAWNDMTKK